MSINHDTLKVVHEMSSAFTVRVPLSYERTYRESEGLEKAREVSSECRSSHQYGLVLAVHRLRELAHRQPTGGDGEGTHSHLHLLTKGYVTHKASPTRGT